MRQVITALIAMTCFLLLLGRPAGAQAPNTASVGFSNKTEVNVIVQGYTIVNGSKKYGVPLQLRKNGSKAFESNVPVGIRYYTICDANNQARVLLNNYPVRIQSRDVLLDIIQKAPNRIMIVPGL